MVDDAPGEIVTVATLKDGPVPSEDIFPSDVKVEGCWGDVSRRRLPPALVSAVRSTILDSHTWCSPQSAF